MSYIIDFFKEIGEVIGKVVDFVAWLIESLLETITLAVNALGTCGYYLTQFPVFWLAPFTAILTIAIIFKIKG